MWVGCEALAGNILQNSYFQLYIAHICWNYSRKMIVWIVIPRGLCVSNTYRITHIHTYHNIAHMYIIAQALFNSSRCERAHTLGRSHFFIETKISRCKPFSFYWELCCGKKWGLLACCQVLDVLTRPWHGLKNKIIWDWYSTDDQAIILVGL